MPGQLRENLLTKAIAVTATTATFAKMFLPFYLIGSTAIFVLTSATASLLTALCWRSFFSMVGEIVVFLLVLAAFYAYICINFLLFSYEVVPFTYLCGIVIFHGLFLTLGFISARALNAVILMLVGAAAVYLLEIIQYITRFGDVERFSYLNDIFGLHDPAIFMAAYQNIGFLLGLAAVAALGLISVRFQKVFVFTALPALLLFLSYISARGAIVALAFSLLFWATTDLYQRSKRIALIGVMVVVLATPIASALFYRHALQDRNAVAQAPDAISRTIREIQASDPSLRLPIWQRAWHRISVAPDNWLLGKGLGVYPIDEGWGAPDWLVHSTEASKHYPHSIHLEMLYETGILGVLLFSILTLMPITWSLRHWHKFSSMEKATVTLFVFVLAHSEISGSFAYGYVLQFFLALTVGTIALKVAKADRTQGPAIA